jgi:hypothetical protein
MIQKSVSWTDTAGTDKAKLVLRAVLSGQGEFEYGILFYSSLAFQVYDYN